MDRKIAASGLNYAVLKLAFGRGKKEGIQQVLSKECGSGPRVTKSSKIIHSIAELLYVIVKAHYVRSAIYCL